MTRHVMEWLGAYQDGELPPARKQAVEAHLEDCADCRTELEALRRLSALVHQEPDPIPSLSAARFAAQVGLRLPRSAPQPAWRPALRLGWLALPGLVVMGWAFVQALGMLAGPLMLALQAGLGGATLSRVLAAPSLLDVAPLMAGLGGLFGLPGGAVSAPTAGGGGWLEGFLLLLALQAGATLVMGILLWGWLASWWVSRRSLSFDRTQ